MPEARETVSYIKEVHCKGTPLEMGRQYGEQAREAIKGNIEHRYCKYQRDLEKDAQFVEIADRMLKHKLPHVYEELQGLAEGADVDLGWMLIMNQWESILPDATPEPASSSLRCTSMIVRDTPQGTLLGKNDDGTPGEYSGWVLRHSEPDEGLPMIQLTYAGWLCGIDAINAAGLVTSHNSTGSKNDKSGELLDIRLRSYDALRSCETVDSFWQNLQEQPLTGKGYNIAVADAQDNAGVIEAAVPELRLRGTEEQFAFATNHYVLDEFAEADNRKPDAKVITQNRYEHLKEVAAKNAPRDLEGLKSVLRDSEGWGPCRYGGATKSETLWSMIGIPSERKLLVTDGAPEYMEYTEYTV